MACQTVLVSLLLLCSLLSFSHGKLCRYSDSNNLDLSDPSLAWATVSYDRVNQGYLFLVDSGTLLLDTQSSMENSGNNNLVSYRNDTSSNLSGLYIPWGYIWYGGTFRLSFSMGVYYAPNSQAPASSYLTLAVLPGYDFDIGGGPNRSMGIQPAAADEDDTTTSSLRMGACKWPVYAVSTGCVQIPIDPARGSVEAFTVYDPLGKRLSVSVGDAARNPDAPYAVAASMAMDLSQLMSAVGQLAQLQAWNLTVDQPLPKGGSPWVIILSSVLGSVAATLVVAAAVYLYLNSRYRRWKKELDQLAKTMQSLPGVPMHVDYAVIKKATNDFHETMKLGKGGFGAVYGCTLPASASASRTGQAMKMKVAVKKFTRELRNKRYEDFLAEVSVINRLRHKNVVPLVGWSYNKEEPLLIYEYMENGSLDHSGRGSSGQQKQQQQTAIVLGNEIPATALLGI